MKGRGRKQAIKQAIQMEREEKKEQSQGARKAAKWEMKNCHSPSVLW